MEMVKRMECPTYEARLRDLDLFSMEKAQGRYHLISVYKYLVGRNEEDISVIPSERTRDNGHKHKYRKSLLNSFSYESSQTLEHIAQRGCGVSILVIFRTQMDTVLSNLL